MPPGAKGLRQEAGSGGFGRRSDTSLTIRTVVAFYDLMFNHSQPAETLRRYVGVRRPIRRDVVADHFSGPRALAGPLCDICDLYAFPSPERPGNFTLVMNVLPRATLS